MAGFKIDLPVDRYIGWVRGVKDRPDPARFSVVGRTDLILQPIPSVPTVITISVARAATLLSCQTGVIGQFSLPYGSDGQLKTITVNTLDIGKSLTISLSGIGFNLLSFISTSTSIVGSSVTLRFFSTLNKWAVVGNNGAMISQV